jgi:CheY-like chemotaxis protein
VNNTNKNRPFMLIADNNVDDRFQTGMLLQQFGYNIFTTTSAGKALAVMSVTPPLAVFADAGEISRAILTEFKNKPENYDIPLILLSTTPNAILEGRTQRGEFAGFLRKPIDAEKLYLIVESAVLKGPRRKIRIATSLRATVSGELGLAEGLVTVLSENGMFFRSLDPYAIQSHLTVNLEIKGRPIALEAEVVYSCNFDEGPFKDPGMGMKFVEIKPEAQAIIKAFILDEIEKNVAR